MRTAYWAWSMILTAAIVIQISLAGYGAFYTAGKVADGDVVDESTFEDGFGIHAGVGFLVILLGLIFLVIGAVAGIGKWRLGRHGLLALLLVLQLFLPELGRQVPGLGFLHVINALAILGLAGWISWDEWQLRKRTPSSAVPT
ncbi:MAG: hypothetical protein ACRDPZ_12795 [Gaiellaceae bacterium]